MAGCLGTTATEGREAGGWRKVMRVIGGAGGDGSLMQVRFVLQIGSMAEPERLWFKRVSGLVLCLELTVCFFTRRT